MASLTQQNSESSLRSSGDSYTFKTNVGSPRGGRRRAVSVDPRSGSFTVKGAWTSEEDTKLAELLAPYPNGNPPRWGDIASHLPGRSGKQCRERYQNYLAPDVKKEWWSTVEDKVFLKVFDVIRRDQPEVKNIWSRVSKYLPGRTPNAVKNHWNSTLKRKYVDASVNMLNDSGKQLIVNVTDIDILVRDNGASANNTSTSTTASPALSASSGGSSLKRSAEHALPSPAIAAKKPRTTEEGQAPPPFFAFRAGGALNEGPVPPTPGSVYIPKSPACLGSIQGDIPIVHDTTMAQLQKQSTRASRFMPSPPLSNAGHNALPPFREVPRTVGTAQHANGQSFSGGDVQFYYSYTRLQQQLLFQQFQQLEYQRRVLESQYGQVSGAPASRPNVFPGPPAGFAPPANHPFATAHHFTPVVENATANGRLPSRPANAAKPPLFRRASGSRSSISQQSSTATSVSDSFENSEDATSDTCSAQESTSSAGLEAPDEVLFRCTQEQLEQLFSVPTAIIKRVIRKHGLVSWPTLGSRAFETMSVDGRKNLANSIRKFLTSSA